MDGYKRCLCVECSGPIVSNRLAMSSHTQSCGLMALPPEVLTMVLARVPLLDLANLRQVCCKLLQLIDGAGGRRLWATVSLEGVAVNETHKHLIERAAGCGNREALIKLAIAYLYNHGVPKGSGAGTLESWNGTRAAELLFQLDTITPNTRPLSWLLIRPPWSSSITNKVCAYNKMVLRCLDQNDDNEKRRKVVSGLFYSLGQTVNFLEVDGNGEEVNVEHTALEWFERGASHNCSFSALQVWRQTMKPNLMIKEVQSLRYLRKIMATGNNCSSQDAKLELCAAYASGYYGSITRQDAMATIRDVMMASRPLETHRIFTVQEDITNVMRYITVDWMVEITELKSLTSHTLHQAVALFDSYLQTRRVDRSELQLLGVTSILVASRWSGATMLTVRESSWLTESTYSYVEVVRMMAELLGTFQGDIKMLTICDYLDILLSLSGQINTPVHSMACYLADSVLLHPELSCYSLAHLAAACLLNAQILLKQDYPWSLIMGQATGFSLSSLSQCCFTIYKRCLTKEYAVADHRGVELCAIANRYSNQSYHSISTNDIISFEELSEQLGVVAPDNYTMMSEIESKINNKLLSFLSDSCYLSSPLCISESDSDTESESDFIKHSLRSSLASSVDGGSITGSCDGLQSSSLNSLCSLPVSALTTSLTNSTCSLKQQQQQQSSFISSSSSSSISPTHLHRHEDYHTATSTNVPSNHSHGNSVPMIPMAMSNCDYITTFSPPPLSISSSLARHSSLNRCDTLSSSGLNEKTDKVHVSCPDFYSCSIDMESGSRSQDEECEMDVCDSYSTDSIDKQAHSKIKESSAVLDFNLVALGGPEQCKLTSLPLMTKSIPPSIDRRGQKSLAQRPTKHIQSPADCHGKTFHTAIRTPLQSLHNTPSAMNTRKQSSGNGKERQDKDVGRGLKHVAIGNSGSKH